HHGSRAGLPLRAAHPGAQRSHGQRQDRQPAGQPPDQRFRRPAIGHADALVLDGRRAQRVRESIGCDRLMRFWLSLALVLAIPAPASAAPALEKVVVLQRHGVRSPTKPVSDYAAYSPTPFAAWPVKPGELTEHGAAALARMGEALRAHYASVLP